MQLHGEPLPYFVDALRAAGAEVIEVSVYRWVGPVDPGPVDRLLDGVLDGSIHALPFTSAPAAASLVALARRTGRLPGLISALSGPVVAACVGPITAGPLAALGVPTVQPHRARIGALARTVVGDAAGAFAPVFGGRACRSSCAASRRWWTASGATWPRPRWRCCGRWRLRRGGWCRGAS